MSNTNTKPPNHFRPFEAVRGENLSQVIGPEHHSADYDDDQYGGESIADGVAKRDAGVLNRAYNHGVNIALQAIRSKGGKIARCRNPYCHHDIGIFIPLHPNQDYCCMMCEEDHYRVDTGRNYLLINRRLFAEWKIARVPQGAKE